MSAVRESASSADVVAVGAGPQILRALADLETVLVAPDGAGAVAHGASPIRVVAIDPDDPGSGAVWRVDQPRYLTMNVSAAVVDLRCPSVPWDLREWHSRELGSPCPTYPSRAIVGSYLGWAWGRLATSAVLDLRHVRGRVVGVERGEHGWECRVVGGETLVSPRVVLGTGHREPVSSDYARLEAGDAGSAAGSTVVVRGAALTAFDAVMCLTAGRGGRWETRLEDAQVPRYRPSRREPGRIVLVSRSGRMMVPKPNEPSEALRAAVAELADRWSQPAPLSEAWWDVLVEAARAAAASMGVELDPARARAWLDESPAAGDTGALTRRWRADLQRADGVVDDDPAWWLGRAWSSAYADLLASIERAPREPETWGRFRRRAAALERWAFGPPAELVARLLALMESGLLTVVREDEAPPPSATDVVAHIAGPGVLPRPRPWHEGSEADAVVPASPLWRGLLAASHVTVRAGETGVLTTPTGGCLGADGNESVGLSALGRPTEGPVVDHDSLQRRLHLDAQRWATAIAKAWTAGARVPTGERQETRR